MQAFKNQPQPFCTMRVSPVFQYHHLSLTGVKNLLCDSMTHATHIHTSFKDASAVHRKVWHPDL